MKKYGCILTAVLLCLSLTGCSVVGGVASSVLVALAAMLAVLAMLRGQSLEQMRRSRRMTRKFWLWLRDQKMLNNLIYMLAAVLLIIGIIVGLVSCGGETEDPTETMTTEQPTTVTEPPTTATEAATEPTEPSENTQETELDLIGIPESLLELMEKNPETRDFVLNYYNRQPMEIDLSDIDRSAGVPLFLQWDQRWGYEIYGSDVIAITGCAPTCVAMVGYYLTGDERFTPDQMAEYAAAGDYYVSGHGTKWTFIGEGIEELGLSTTELPLTKGVIVQNLRAGNPVIVVVGPGDFTTTGHFLVIVGYEDGMFRINDPNSVIRSDQLWSYETLEPQIRNLWAVNVG